MSRSEGRSTRGSGWSACSLCILLGPVLAGSLLLSPAPGDAQAPVPRWEVAGPYPMERVDRAAYPNFYAIFLAPWQEVWSGPEGVVDLDLHVARENPAGDLALARTVFWSDREKVVTLAFGYAGEIDLFFDGWKIFSGQRPNPRADQDPSASPGGSEQLPLYVKKGLNEILVMASSRSGRWAFQAATSEPLTPPASAAGATELWATPATLLTPESVLKDPSREILYVSSFDNEFSRKPEPSGYISKLAMDGSILEHRWVEGLSAPTGMDSWRDTLYVAEREHLLAIDMATGEVVGRWPIPDPVFPNDLIIDGEGTIYISDTRTNDWAESRIYRFKDGRFDVFANEGISRANGLWIHDGWLLVGSSGDGLLKRVELSTGRIETVVSLGAGIIDGIRVDPEGNYLVSHWEGKLFRITPAGEVLELLDARSEGWNTADFEYLPDEAIVLFPTFLDNRVRAVRIPG